MFPVLAAVHAAALVAMPASMVIALGVWWNANTIAHNFIHRPFFRQRIANEVFAAALSVLNGFPQSWWRDRHLSHHARGHGCDRSVSRATVLEAALILSLWAAIAARWPRFFLVTYVPGYLGGLALCALHGYYEHARGTTSHYGRLYNLLLFNDGYHVEHHANPSLPWRRLPARRRPGTNASRWPAPLRWMEYASLDTLERLVLRSRLLQWFVLRTHARAWRELLAPLAPIDRVVIVGGGLFPRSALIAGALAPDARITIVDANRANLDRTRAFIDRPTVNLVHERYAGGARGDCLLVIPLSFDGDRNAIYRHPPAPAVLVHDWIWRRRGDSRIVSLLLLKRLNLVRTASSAPGGANGCASSRSIGCVSSQ